MSGALCHYGMAGEEQARLERSKRDGCAEHGIDHAGERILLSARIPLSARGKALPREEDPAAERLPGGSRSSATLHPRLSHFCPAHSPGLKVS